MSCKHERPVCRVEVEGDLTVQEASRQKARLLKVLRVPYTVIELDLAQVSEIDTAGLQLLLVSCGIAMTMGGALKLVNVSPAVSALLSLLCLGPRFAQAANHCAECEAGPAVLPEAV